MLDQLQVYDDLEPRPAALNMAVDEALLENASLPVLRFYGWEQASFSFGYFGHYSEVKKRAGHRPIVRRWTGGGIVPHGEDLTYSVIVPAGHAFLVHSSTAIYAALHNAIRRALEANGVSASLAGEVTPKISDDCFANPVRADLIGSDGGKIAGAAHRRSRLGLLHQGSIQRSDLPAAFRRELARILCEQYDLKTLSPQVLARAASISATKYGTKDWLIRR